MAGEEAVDVDFDGDVNVVETALTIAARVPSTLTVNVHVQVAVNGQAHVKALMGP